MNYFVWMKMGVSGRGYPTLMEHRPNKDESAEMLKCVYGTKGAYAIHKLTDEDKAALASGVVKWNEYLPQKYPLSVGKPDPAFPMLTIETRREKIVTDVVETIDGAVYAS